MAGTSTDDVSSGLEVRECVLARPEVIGTTQHLPAFALAGAGPGDGILIAVHEIGD